MESLRAHHGSIQLQQKELTNMRTTNRFLLSTGFLAAFALAACEPADTADDFTLESPDAPIMDPADPAAAPMPADGRSFATDAEIFSFVSTANTYEIESAELALSRASSEQVREFATALQAEHEAIRSRVAETVEPTDAAPLGELDQADDLVNFHRDAMEDLAGQEGADFDAAWVQYQIDMHERTLEGLTEAMSANPNPELAQALTEAQAQLQQHLVQARSLQEQLEAAPTS